MFPCSIFEFLLSVVVTIALASSKPCNASAKTVVPANSETGLNFVINNNCGPVSADGQMMADIKAKVDYIATQFDKGRPCPTGWVLHGKSCYLVIDVPTLEWNDARRNCQKLGGDLAKITSAAQNQFIFNLLLKQEKVMYYGAWLGLHRKADTKFYWTDDTPLTNYTAWYAGEPSNPSSEKCGHIIASGSAKGKWNDWQCSVAKSYINVAPVVLCQKEI